MNKIHSNQPILFTGYFLLLDVANVVEANNNNSSNEQDHVALRCPLEARLPSRYTRAFELTGRGRPKAVSPPEK